MSSSDLLPKIHTPPDFAKASASYRRRVWLALLGLLTFLVLYVGMASWFTYTTYRMVLGVIAGGPGAVPAFFTAIPFAFLAIFLWKALLFVRHGDEDPGREITPADQPELFEFLYQLADRVGAPRPHRVFLCPGVNASVFYDLSILNLIIPSKKNLTIGLGLVNSLNRTELTAVLAHEFGHFAQRSMAVGSWVYVGEQIAAAIIAKRDFLDRTLDFISRIDLRLAWIGWIMRLVVWSIRAVMEAVFRWVVLAHRALSREMEFQADLVAVSVTGSDALIHALYRLQAADDDWGRSCQFAATQIQKGRAVEDLFAVQTRIGEHLRRILDDPAHQGLPLNYETLGAQSRVFSEKLAQPPQMWSTHPPNTEREANTKRTYLSVDIDEESAWSYFRDPAELQKSVTKFLIDKVELKEEPTLLPTEEALQLVDQEFSRESFAQNYRGAYLGRSVTLAVAEANQLYGDHPTGEEIKHALTELYPEHLQGKLAELRSLEEEINLLEGVQQGHYDATGNVVRYRGNVVRRQKLPQLITEVKQERDHCLAEIERHDAHCRSVHEAAAHAVGNGWPQYLRSLTMLLHYADHSHADLEDAHGFLANVTMMATAAGQVSAKNLRKIINAANEVQVIAAKLDSQASTVRLPAPILERLEIEDWRAAFEKFDLPSADEQNIGKWMEVVDSWILPIQYRFDELRDAVLEELLRAERKVASIYLGKQETEVAPDSATAPPQYETLVRGTQRERQTKLDWWSQFMLASGTGPSILRFMVAASLVVTVIALGIFVGTADVTIYNGLNTPVAIQMNNRELTLVPRQHHRLTVGTFQTLHFTTKTTDGREIESISERPSAAFGHYVYNVAGAAPLIEWDEVYGNATPKPARIVGAPRWVETSAQHVFENPPNQVKTKSEGATRSVLSNPLEDSPFEMLAVLGENGPQREQVIRAHARFDSPESPSLFFWLSQAETLPDFSDILTQRLAAHPNDVAVLRLLYDKAEPAEQVKIKQQQLKQAAEHPQDPNWQYIAARLMPHGPEQDERFIALLDQWPDNPWLNNAVAYIFARQGNWQKALSYYQACLQKPCALQSEAAVVMARLRRADANGAEVQYNDLTFHSNNLKMILEMESGNRFQGTPMSMFQFLSKGQLEQAYQVGGGENMEPFMLDLFAASSGAPQAAQDKALARPVAEIEEGRTLPYLAALAARNGKDPEPYLQRLQDLAAKPGESDNLADVIRQAIAAGKPSDDLAERLQTLDPIERGMALAAIAMLYPDQLAEKWKQQARGLLFVMERPYIK
ncbi:Zn-dependent protease with chaperone function [Bremerella cremea]|uniref:Zn-dependent protease with chaperone function n=1 Tax=Bremerella cremea TaxID=1031537 RepID=A0A368KU10_9BACT|nr:M48 family metalloprotease [Bremerella cremea]RCS53913.1 Zn-dependent protease with chaperone function [Bremerella cremea]